MTENKRFKVTVYDDGFQSIYDIGNDEYLTEMDLSKIEKLLNKLNNENEQLKQQIKDMKIRFKRKYDHEFDEIVDELW